MIDRASKLKEERIMFKSEVDFRLTKWLIANLSYAGLITDEEMRMIWKRAADHYKSPFSELEDFRRTIGEGVTVDER